MDTRKKVSTETAIANHSATISTRARNGDRHPKKNTDHKTLSINCAPKNANAVFTPFAVKPLSQTRNAATAIKKNNVTQTGAKTALGGVKLGFCNSAYHVGMDGVVNNEPMNPANWQTTTAVSNFTAFFNSILVPFNLVLRRKIFRAPRSELPTAIITQIQRSYNYIYR